jgi:hypothetical protein
MKIVADFEARKRAVNIGHELRLSRVRTIVADKHKFNSFYNKMNDS